MLRELIRTLYKHAKDLRAHGLLDSRECQVARHRTYGYSHTVLSAIFMWSDVLYCFAMFSAMIRLVLYYV